ncbi:5-formyltetrahydrofolate cyclo-ligase [Thermohalobacter berrensis]|uniref:5-formyltetrahydrofolate cyclo-ligase n=1 Tax=Thermohalobacter berrensis TaxID=99594 RepID=A0A419SXV8_9FIRM|nr:5-formyltetrahydrofolate cyclo-ligase [Thermohalobacter berrensis]RKD30087.1 5-formyltetrahydrofolate cyclo-ligase [Thermohalobacter berrensis]
MEKQKIRNEILTKRKNLSEKDIINKSKKICDLFLSTVLFKKSKNIMAYVDFRNEVKTEHIIKTALSKGKNIFIPITITKTKELLLSQLKDYDNELTKGTYGILEPKEEYIRKSDPDLLDLIIVPGVAFDKRGYRIGYGGGYYDRFLGKLNKEIPKIALAFDVQIVPKIIPDKFDIPVDFIITENAIINCTENRS